MIKIIKCDHSNENYEAVLSNGDSVLIPYNVIHDFHDLPSSVAGVVGVTGMLSAVADSPFSASDLFRFFPGVGIVESLTGLYVFTSLIRKESNAVKMPHYHYPDTCGHTHPARSLANPEQRVSFIQMT